jgi:hypothetical protein
MHEETHVSAVLQALHFAQLMDGFHGEAKLPTVQ